MWTNNFWPEYWADRYWPTIAGEPPEPPAASTDIIYVIGMGVMGKTRIHPYPLFSRVKQ